MLPFEVYHWLLTGIFAAGFTGAIITLWNHRCECIHDREWSRRYGSGPHEDGD